MITLEPLGRTIPIEPLVDDAFAEFGLALGGSFPGDSPGVAFGHAGSDFWHAHDFDPGAGGTTEVLWVEYRDDSLRVRTLEAHWLTEQAIVPLADGEIVHVVCPTRDDGARLPDIARMRAFRVGPGRGVCMRPGVWHASFAAGGPATCLMLTRGSTTRDLVAHLKRESVAAESSIVSIANLGRNDPVVRA